MKNIIHLLKAIQFSILTKWNAEGFKGHLNKLFIILTPLFNLFISNGFFFLIFIIIVDYIFINWIFSGIKSPR